MAENIMLKIKKFQDLADVGIACGKHSPWQVRFNETHGAELVLKNSGVVAYSDTRTLNDTISEARISAFHLSWFSKFIANHPMTKGFIPKLLPQSDYSQTAQMFAGDVPRLNLWGVSHLTHDNVESIISEYVDVLFLENMRVDNEWVGMKVGWFPPGTREVVFGTPYIQNKVNLARQNTNNGSVLAFDEFYWTIKQIGIGEVSDCVARWDDVERINELYEFFDNFETPEDAVSLAALMNSENLAEAQSKQEYRNSVLQAREAFKPGKKRVKVRLIENCVNTVEPNLKTFYTSHCVVSTRTYDLRPESVFNIEGGRGGKIRPVNASISFNWKMNVWHFQKKMNGKIEDFPFTKEKFYETAQNIAKKISENKLGHVIITEYCEPDWAQINSSNNPMISRYGSGPILGTLWVVQDVELFKENFLSFVYETHTPHVKGRKENLYLVDPDSGVASDMFFQAKW